MSRRPCVLFVINSLAAGGAERQLTELVRNMDKARFDVHVAVFYGPGNHNGGELWPEMASIPGATLHDLHKRKGPLGYFTTLPRLAALIVRVKADILHGYLEGNLPVLLLGGMLRKRVVWGIRRSFSDLSKLNRLSMALLKLRLLLARFTDLMIFNSRTSLANHRSMGMKGAAARVIPNGFDIHRFRPDPALRASQRSAWGIPPEAELVGIVGRLDEVKDHPAFLHAAARLAGERPEARFVCVGRGGEAYTKSLKALAGSLGIAAKVYWAGVSREMPSAYNALDALALTSTDEGFPNVVGEAMACGIPCVATRVGDAALLVGDTGFIAEPGDVDAIHQGLRALLTEPAEARRLRALACRNHIVDAYSVEALARHTEEQLMGLLSPASAAAPCRERP